MTERQRKAEQQQLGWGRRTICVAQYALCCNCQPVHASLMQHHLGVFICIGLDAAIVRILCIEAVNVSARLQAPRTAKSPIMGLGIPGLDSWRYATGAAEPMVQCSAQDSPMLSALLTKDSSRLASQLAESLSSCGPSSVHVRDDRLVGARPLVSASVSVKAVELHSSPLPQHSPWAVPTTMANAHEDEPPPSVRFKRRKTTHAKRILTRDDGPTESTSQLPNGATAHDAPSLSADTATAEEPALNLKEILRNRTKLRDRYKAPARKVDTASTQLVAADPPRPDQYTSRFVAQTGQVVDRDDKQM